MAKRKVAEIVQLAFPIPEEHRIADVAVIVTCTCGASCESHCEAGAIEVWATHDEEART